MINDADLAVGSPDKLQRLIHVLYLVIVGMRSAVRGNKAINTERSIVGLVTKVATIGIVPIFQNALVYPVPNGGSTDAAIGIDDIPIFLEVSDRRRRRCPNIYGLYRRRVGR